ncbi:MAG: hypothetical protein ACK6A9_19535 [Dolichospermum sp.]
MPNLYTGAGMANLYTRASVPNLYTRAGVPNLYTRAGRDAHPTSMRMKYSEVWFNIRFK